MMTKISYAGYRFPPVIIQQAIWLYARFTLSFRDVEDLLAEREIAVSYETVRRWVNHFGPRIAADLHKRRPKPHTTWHLDEVYLKIDGRLVYLWRAVDSEGELDVLVQTKRNRAAALKLMRKLLKKYGFLPENLVTDDLRSYHAAARDLGIEHRHRTGRWRNKGRRIRINRPTPHHLDVKVQADTRGATTNTLNQTAEEFLALANRLLRFVAPHFSDKALRATNLPRRLLLYPENNRNDVPIPTHPP